MRTTAYAWHEALTLLPLLESIAREMRERDEALRRILAELRGIEKREGGRSAEARLLAAEAADHRTALREIRSEIERLGCEGIGVRPPTIRIPAAGVSDGETWVWRLGDLLPRRFGAVRAAGLRVPS
ncbi:MAG: DUF2203 family protein [Planctomycetota bacterium]